MVWSPANIVCDVGEAESEKSPADTGFTTSVTCVVWLKLPLVPVTVNGYVPAGVLLVVVTVRDELLPPAGFGPKLPLAPEGSPLTFKLTPPENPPVRVMVTAYEVLAPCVTVWLEGEAESEKSAGCGAVTTSVADVV